MSANNSNVESRKVAASRCWTGYEPVPGKAPYSNDSCRPVAAKKKEKKAALQQTSWPQLHQSLLGALLNMESGCLKNNKVAAGVFDMFSGDKNLPPTPEQVTQNAVKEKAKQQAAEAQKQRAFDRSKKLNDGGVLSWASGQNARSQQLDKQWHQKNYERSTVRPGMGGGAPASASGAPGAVSNLGSDYKTNPQVNPTSRLYASRQVAPPARYQEDLLLLQLPATQPFIEGSVDVGQSQPRVRNAKELLPAPSGLSKAPTRPASQQKPQPLSATPAARRPVLSSQQQRDNLLLNQLPSTREFVTEATPVSTRRDTPQASIYDRIMPYLPYALGAGGIGLTGLLAYNLMNQRDDDEDK